MPDNSSGPRVHSDAAVRGFGLVSNPESVLKNDVFVTAGGIRYHGSGACALLQKGQAEAKRRTGITHPVEHVDVATALKYRPLKARKPCVRCIDPAFGDQVRLEFFAPFIELWQECHETLSTEQRQKLARDEKLDQLIVVPWESIVFAVVSCEMLSEIVDRAHWHRRSGGIVRHQEPVRSVGELLALMHDAGVEVDDIHDPGWSYFVRERRGIVVAEARKLAREGSRISASDMRTAWRRSRGT